MTAGTAPTTVDETRAPATRGNWLLSARADVLFFQLSVLVSVGLFFAWKHAQISTTNVFLLWIFGFHGSHFWAQISRTYLDSSEWKERGGMLLKMLGWMLLGPVWVGIALVSGNSWMEKAFIAFAGTFAYHHVIKQHFGFIALYRAKKKQFHPIWFPLEKWHLMLSLWLPLALYFLNQPDIWFTFDPNSKFQAENLTAINNGRLLAADVVFAAFWALQLAYLSVVIWQLMNRRGVNLQANAVAFTAIGLHYLVLSELAAAHTYRAEVAGLPIDFYAIAIFVPLITIFHNIQYHALVWHYNRRKYGKNRVDPTRRYGWAHLVNHNFAVYLLFGTLYTVLTIGLEQYPGVKASIPPEYLPLFGSIFWGFAFLHYDLDAKIWKVSKDENLRAVLGFTR